MLLQALAQTIVNPKDPGEVEFFISESGGLSTKPIEVMIHQIGHVDDRPSIVTFSGIAADGPCSGYYRYLSQEGEFSIVSR